MATFFKDYEELVLQAYERKKVDNELPHGLKYLTPAKLKEECVVRCKKGVNRLDEMIIREFCGDLDESKKCPMIIQHCGTDKFRPLVNYLKKKSEKTDPKNIELLAWLIDFPHRPWELGKKYPDGANENPPLSDTGPVAGEPETVVNTPANESDIQTGIPENPENPMRLLGEDVDTKTEKAGKQVKKGRSRKRLAATVVLSLVLATGGAWLLIHIYTRPGGCMYWSEDHYKPIACDQKIPNVRIIALDMTKLKNFRKITTPDTITYQAIGKVWYSKIDNKIEFYTWYGEHPVIYGRWLKPITKYIIDIHIRQGMVTK
ncbi:hypothetical protein [Chitinophaga sp. GbtcB8]|uniref:hypothetical protein n=1 Tax=Chitinophaga sp. GbtcB8 TaxID=2824753 RepID=UPI001C2F8098|nr:hypothetical protein [Chitinophaga sp. GbtcB8]